MGKFDASQGPVSLRLIENRTSFEVFQAMQGETPVGAMRLDWTRGGAVVETIDGHGHGAYMQPIVKRFETVLGYNGRVTPFGDFWDMPAYDTPFRTVHAEWFFKHRSVIDAIIVRTQSKIVLMGASVANIAAGGLFRTFSTRPEFDALLSKHSLPGKRPVPQ